MPLKLLSEDDYRGAAKGSVVTDGQKAHTHIALIDIDPSKKPARCYVKLYPDQIGNKEHRGIVNEMVGHVVAVSMGAPVPNNAGLITLHASQLANRPAWASPDSNLVGWWVEDAAAPSLKAYYEIDEKTQAPAILMAKLQRVREELAKSEHVNLIIAFDDLVANVDRNIGNLLRVKKGQYVMIDHGLCFASESWEISDLDPSLNFLNKLNVILDSSSQFLPFRHATVRAHEHLAASIDPAMKALLKWLPYAVNDAESAAIERFIRHRANPSGITERMELFI